MLNEVFTPLNKNYEIPFIKELKFYLFFPKTNWILYDFPLFTTIF
jgi:hypothetical protein